MQIENSPRFMKRFMIGLIASSAGAFVALPGAAMPEAEEVGTETEVIAPVEVLSEPTAEEALPTSEMDAADTEASTELTEATPAEAVEEAEVPTEAVEPIAEDDMAEDMPVADEVMVEEPVADEAADEAVEEPIAAEEAVEEPVATDEVTDEAIEEPVAAEEAVEETVEEVAEEPIEEEVTADEAIEDEVDAPVAEESLETPEEPTASEEMNTDDFTITELTGSSDSFEILAAALEAAELSEVLSGEGPFTVFAPTDEAFEALPEGAIEQLLLPENKEVLIQVLTYHVVPGAVLSTDLETGAVATVEGSELAVEVAETVTVNNANVIAADVTASNGVIHVIDSVILPPAPEADAGSVEAEDETASVQ